MSHPESYLLLALRLKKVKCLIESQKYNCAIRMFDMIINTIDDDYIKLKMFFGCIYLVQKMYPDAIEKVENVKSYISRHVMGKEMLKKRILTKSKDIGCLDELSDLCLQNILSKV